MKCKPECFNKEINEIVKLGAIKKLRRLKLKNKDFTLFSNNCVAGDIYRSYGLKYMSPTVGAFFWDDGYIRFLEEKLWRNKISFVDESRYPLLESYRVKTPYQIGCINGVEIHFPHYTSRELALSAWNRRVERINEENIYAMFFDKYEFKEEYYERFKRLPYRKLFFSSKYRTPSDDVVYVEEAEHLDGWNKLVAKCKYKRYINTTDWLNRGTYTIS